MSENSKHQEKALTTSASTAAIKAATIPVANELGTHVEPKAGLRSPNFMASRRVLPDVVDAAVERGVRVILTKAGYEIDGFYRAGPIRLEPDQKNGGLVAIDRKEVSVAISTFDELVRLNYECWKKSRDKGAAYINPGREWLEEFARLNLVKRQVIFIPGED